MVARKNCCNKIFAKRFVRKYLPQNEKKITNLRCMLEHSVLNTALHDLSCLYEEAVLGTFIFYEKWIGIENKGCPGTN